MKKIRRKKRIRRQKLSNRQPTKVIGGDIESSSSIAMIYRSELDYISRCILDSKTIETGGQLFGFWTSTGTPVVLYAIGPGPRANHQVTFFNQDVDYLVKVGTELLQRYGLQHIGEWHSHHQLGLAQPSGHDASNMQTVIDSKHLGRFLLCIGNCDDHVSTLNAFNFTEGEPEYQRAAWMIKEMDSPFRTLIDDELRSILVHPKCGIPNMIDRNVYRPDEPVFKERYWLSDKENNRVLKKIIDFLSQFSDNKGCDVELDREGRVHIFLDKADNSREEILFPNSFPKEAPVVRIQDRVVKSTWRFDGDIYHAFILYYWDIMDKTTDISMQEEYNNE